MITGTSMVIIRDATSGSDLWHAARVTGGAKEVEISSTDDDGDLHRTASDLLAWVEAHPQPLAAEREAIRHELRFLVHRARTRAFMHAKQYRRRAALRVALAREGDHLLALLTEV